MNAERSRRLVVAGWSGANLVNLRKEDDGEEVIAVRRRGGEERELDSTVSLAPLNDTRADPDEHRPGAAPEECSCFGRTGARANETRD